MKKISKKISVHFVATFSVLLSMYMMAVSKPQDDDANGNYKLEISFIKEDTVKKVKAVITSIDSLKPIKDVEVKFYAKKSFGLLPLSEEGMELQE